MCHLGFALFPRNVSILRELTYGSVNMLVRPFLLIWSFSPSTRSSRVEEDQSCCKLSSTLIIIHEKNSHFPFWESQFWKNISLCWPWAALNTEAELGHAFQRRYLWPLIHYISWEVFHRFLTRLLEVLPALLKNRQNPFHELFLTYFSTIFLFNIAPLRMFPAAGSTQCHSRASLAVVVKVIMLRARRIVRLFSYILKKKIILIETETWNCKRGLFYFLLQRKGAFVHIIRTK